MNNSSKKTKKINLVIFDLDGTLIDSTTEIAFIVNCTLKKNGYPERSKKFYTKNIGSGISDLLKKSLPKRYNKDFMSLLSDTNFFYSTYLNKKSQTFTGIEKILNLLKNKNIRIGIVTNKLHKLALRCVNHYFSEYDIITIGAEYKFKRKPDPSSALEIIKLYDIQSKESILIGDSIIDIQTAKNANMHSGGVLWGNGTLKELEPADEIFKNPRELLNYFLEI